MFLHIQPAHSCISLCYPCKLRVAYVHFVHVSKLRMCRHCQGDVNSPSGETSRTLCDFPATHTAMPPDQSGPDSLALSLKRIPYVQVLIGKRVSYPSLQESPPLTNQEIYIVVIQP